MKILFVLPEYLPQTGGGIVTYYAALLPALRAAGHEVRVLYGSSVVSQPGGGTSTVDGIETEILDSTLFARYLPLFSRYQIVPKLQRTLAAAWALWEQARKYPAPDVVEVTDWGLLFVPWILRAGPPTIAALHGSMGQIARHDPLDGEQVADALIQAIEVHGLSAAEEVLSYGSANVDYWAGVLGRKVELVRPVWRPHTPVDTGGERTERGLVVGRVQHWKGPHILCEAMRLLGPRGPDIDWVGRDVPLHHQGGSTTRHLAQTWPDVWGPKVHHLPGESPQKLQQRQAKAGFVVVPSIWDVFNFTCIEAMTAGAPVICSSGAGASDLIESGVSGYVSTSGDGRSLAEQIENLLALDPRRRQEMGRAGAEVVARALSLEATLSPRLDDYRTVNRSGPPPGGRDEWLSHVCAPDETQVPLDSYLKELSLNRLLRHSLGRIGQRLRRRPPTG